MAAGFQVQPGEDIVVVELLRFGEAVDFYFDPACTALAGTPTVTSLTAFYVPTPGSFTISLKVDDVEYATVSGVPRAIQLSAGSTPVFSPVPAQAGTGTISKITSDTLDITAPEGPVTDIEMPTPSTPPGAVLVLALPFAHGDAGLATGKALFTPTSGDVLLDAWIEVDTAWNGTTPKGDILLYGLAEPGMYARLAGAGSPANQDMTQADATVGNQKVGASINSLSGVNASAVPTGVARSAPAKFVSGGAVGVVVSQDGTISGGSPGATQGSAVLFLVTATPA